MKFIEDGCYHTLAMHCVMIVAWESMMTRIFYALSESHLILWNDMYVCVNFRDKVHLTGKNVKPGKI